MKKICSTMILLILILLPVMSDASSLILLKNGGQVVTPFYWFEGRYIFFYYAGGTAGIERKEIERILSSEAGEKQDTGNIVVWNPGVKAPPPEPSLVKKAQEADKPREEKEAKVDIEAYKNKKDQLNGELEGLLEQQRQAAGSADDLAVILRELRREVMLHTIARDLTGRGDLAEVVGNATTLAEQALDAAASLHHALLAADHGEPRDPQGAAERLVVGRELDAPGTETIDHDAAPPQRERAPGDGHVGRSQRGAVAAPRDPLRAHRRQQRAGGLVDGQQLPVAHEPAAVADDVDHVGGLARVHDARVQRVGIARELRRVVQRLAVHEGGP